uniref:Uncharacterized protein n=1 Tax=Rhizophora mucronata TaxID=61149 RepID=A0A2P2J2A9_RHIMU
MDPDRLHCLLDQIVRIVAGVHVKNTPESGTGNFGGPTFNANVNIVLFAWLERGPERPFKERKKENIGPARVRFIKNHHLGLVFKVPAIGAHPEGGPPDLEPENAHEPNVLESPNRDNVPVLGLLRVKPNKRTNGGD